LFGFYLIGERGLLGLALDSDRSRISYVILGLYALLSLHWLYLVLALSTDQKCVDDAYVLFEQSDAGSLVREENRILVDGQEIRAGIFSDYLRDLIRKNQNTSNSEVEHGILLDALGERLVAKHAFGHFASDMLLKLGLLGTIVGFIMMLTPVGELTDFDPNVLQQLLGQMSGGMAVALFTTISGLTTSTLLGLQYQLLDSAAIRFIDRVAVSVDVLVIPMLANGHKTP
jgi:MotA/TolQ/ExbB proton channel family